MITTTSSTPTNASASPWPGNSEVNPDGRLLANAGIIFGVLLLAAMIMLRIALSEGSLHG
jgi:hypothetical protein